MSPAAPSSIGHADDTDARADGEVARGAVAVERRAVVVDPAPLLRHQARVGEGHDRGRNRPGRRGGAVGEMTAARKSAPAGASLALAKMPDGLGGVPSPCSRPASIVGPIASLIALPTSVPIGMPRRRGSRSSETSPASLQAATTSASSFNATCGNGSSSCTNAAPVGRAFGNATLPESVGSGVIALSERSAGEHGDPDRLEHVRAGTGFASK